MIERCPTWGTGPIGTAGDGCHDLVEAIFLGVVTAIVAAATVRAGPERRVTALLGSTLAASSIYHVVFGEGTIADAVAVAEGGNPPHAAVLALVNSRELTVPATTAVVGWWVRTPAAAVAAAAVAISVPLASYDHLPGAVGALAAMDVVGFLCGVWIAAAR